MGIKKIIRAKKQSMMQLLSKHKYAAAYLNDSVLRTKIALLIGSVISIAYVVLNLASGIYYGSAWNCAIAAYYLALGLLRIFTLHNVRHITSIPSRHEAQLQSLRQYRMTGLLLLLLGLAMSGMILLVVLENQVHDYPGVFIYLYTAVAFYYVSISLHHVIHTHRNGYIMRSATKAIQLAASIMSLYVVQVDLISRFGHRDSFRLAMNSVSGGLVILAVLSISIYMLQHSTRKRNKLRSKNNCGIVKQTSSNDVDS